MWPLRALANSSRHVLISLLHDYYTESRSHVHSDVGDYNASLFPDALKGHSNSRETKEADSRFQKFTLDPQHSTAFWSVHIKGGMFRVVPSRNFPRTWTWVWVRDGDEMMWRHIFVTFRHISGSMWRCQVSKKFLLVLPKMWRFSWNLVQMWLFRHIVTSFFWVRLGTKQSLKTWPGPGFWVPDFPISAWNVPHPSPGDPT